MSKDSKHAKHGAPKSIEDTKSLRLCSLRLLTCAVPLDRSMVPQDDKIQAPSMQNDRKYQSNVRRGAMHNCKSATLHVAEGPTHGVEMLRTRARRGDHSEGKVENRFITQLAASKVM